MKVLGKVGRKKEYQFHWAVESKRGYEKLIIGYGISKGKSNLDTGSFSFCEWDGHQWFEKRVWILNKGKLKT